MSLLPYLKEYIKTNQLTLFFALALLAISCVKYFKYFGLRLGTRHALMGILALGFLLRILWVCFSSHTPKFYWEETGMQEWDIINAHATDLLKGIWFRGPDGLPMARRPIGYPMFLGFVYAIFGAKLWVLRLTHLALFLITGLLIYRIGKLVFSERVALVATFLFAVYPVSIYSVAFACDENLFLPLWYFGIYLLLEEVHGRRRPGALVWYGVIFGFAAMTRTHAVLMPIVVFLTYLGMKRSWKQCVGAFFVVFALMQLVNLPWVIRNYKVWKVPVIYTATSQYLYASMNSYASPEGGSHIPEVGEPGYSAELEQAKLSGNTGLYHVKSNQKMMEWIFTHPKEFLYLGSARLLVFMGWNRSGGVWPLWFQFSEGAHDVTRAFAQPLKDFFEEAAYAFYYGVLFSFIFSIAFLLKTRSTLTVLSRVSLLTLGGCFVIWWAEHMIIYADRKYRFPLEPLMMIVASYYLHWLLTEFRWEKRWAQRRRRL